MYGHNDAITDVEGIKVGHWTDLEAATGCTVVLCESGAMGGVDVRGGAAGTRGIESVRAGTLVKLVHAVLLTGGSAYGLDAASGVMRWCEERGIGLEFGGTRVPIVAAANLFDLAVGRADVRPDPASGYAAAQTAAAGPVERGSVGAGTGATVAKGAGREFALKGGIGSASEVLAGGIVVGAIAAVNASGEILGAGVTLAGPRDTHAAFKDTLALMREGLPAPLPPENTTLAVVATNATLSKEQANHLAAAGQDGIARAVRPAHTIVDGDVVFSLATGAVELIDTRHFVAVETMAAIAVERAIRDAVVSATSLAGVPSLSEWLSRA